MAQSHARQSPSNNLNKRPSLQRPPAQHAAARTGENALPFGPMNSETVLRLQPVIGNQGVQHILARSHGAASANSAGTRFIQRGRDPEFTFGGQSIERTTLRTQEELNKAVESTIDEELGGVDNLFLKNVVATSVADWRDLVFDNLESYYTLEGLAKPQVLIAVNWVKDKHRQATLRRYAESYVYSSEDGPPYSLDNFKQRMVENGVYLERNDDAGSKL